MHLQRLFIPFLFVLCGSAGATTYSVGPSGCTHFSLADALAAARVDGNGPHLIKLRSGELTTGGISLDEPVADITIEGGYASCTASAPTTDARMVIRQINPARVLRFDNASDTPRTLELRHLTLTGGDENATDLLGGGGALVMQNATLVLGAGTRIEGNRAGNGGGVSLFGTPSRIARLTITGDAEISENAADGLGGLGNGGGVFALDNAEIRLLYGIVQRNNARRAGGGIALSTRRTTLTVAPQSAGSPLATAILFFNQSGTDTFTAGAGFGGAIYSKQGNITISAPASNRFTTFITDNRGNFGGAIYAEGESDPAGPFTFISMRNAYIRNNQAIGKGGAFYSRNAVDWVLDHNAPAGQRCHYSGRSTPCSVVRGNAAFNSTSEGTAGGGVGYVENDTGSPRGIFRFSRTLFDANADFNGGKAAVAIARGSSEMIFERCIFTANEADTGNDGAMLMNAPGIGLRFVYDTVLQNTVDTLVYMDGGVFRNQGSIMWSPGSEVWTPVAGATMENNVCLIAHQAVPGATVADPQLDDDFTPPGRSPAIDFCDDLDVPAGADSYRAAAGYDVAGIGSVWGTNDLGAVESRDILFFDGFGSRFLQ